MGLLGTGIKYGTIFVVAREGLKSYENHKQKKQTRDVPPQPIQQGDYVQQTFPQQPTDYPHSVSESFHQVWCNRQCGGKCTAALDLSEFETRINSPRQHIDSKPPVY